ncbi:nuclear transport factor 2 family protein [Nocardia sp. NPDC060256]|uniref:nuclear transport factor 2 family protein n=1 Tax=unclassified Nocardia TaxID=2637762 RepID=UPI00366097D1
MILELVSINDSENAVRGDVVWRMEEAMNAHDLDALVDCFTEDFRSDLPIHPGRSFVGREHVRNNWAGIFARVPDLSATVLQSVAEGGQAWAEWEIGGTTVAGERYLSRGVSIIEFRDGRAASVRFYLDDVDPSDGSEAGR